MPEKINQSSGESPRVLLVEDEAIIGQDLQIQLRNSGVAVTAIAGRAVDAFFQIEQTDPDLILMDIKIKGDMDGVEAAGVIRGRYGLPVIYLTSASDEATLARARLTEPFGYLIKPTGRMNLKPLIATAIQKHRRERKLQSSCEMLHKIVQSIPAAVIAADSDGEVFFLNRAGEAMTGWTLQDATRQKLETVALICDRENRNFIPELLEQTRTREIYLDIPASSRLTTRQGRTLEVSGQIAAVRSIGNSFIEIFVILSENKTRAH